MKFINIAYALMFLLIPSFAISAAITTISNEVQPLTYSGDPSDTDKFYMDAYEGNPDMVMQICGVGAKYVIAGYGAKLNTGDVIFVPITYSSGSQSMSYANMDLGNGCYRVPEGGKFVVSPSAMDLTPKVYKAAFPGQLWAMYSDVSTGTNAEYVFMGTNAVLLGSYKFPTTYYKTGFDRTNNLIVFPTTIQVRFITPGGSFTKQLNDGTFGINNAAGRLSVFAVCEDEHGENCYSAQVVGDFSSNIAMNTGIDTNEIDDQHVFHRFAVINGLGNLVCIGPEIATSISLDKTEVIWSDNITATIQIRNIGNVEITTPFKIKIEVLDYNNNVAKEWEETINSLDVDGIYTTTKTWPAFAHSGTYTFKVTADYADSIKEWEDDSLCASYAASNQNSRTFALKDAKMVTIIVDNKTMAYWYEDSGKYVPYGYNNLSFERAGKLYNLTIHIASTDELYESNPVPIKGATIYLEEINGLNPFIPLQIWNSTLDGNNETFYTLSKNAVIAKTDDNGDVNLAIIPTGNKFYLEQYAYMNISQIIGNYSIIFHAEKDGEPLNLVIAPAEFTTQLKFNVTNLNYKTADISTYNNENSYVRIILSWIAQAISNAWRALIR